MVGSHGIHGLDFDSVVRWMHPRLTSRERYDHFWETPSLHLFRYELEAWTARHAELLARTGQAG